jgi:hypothetical protein
VLTLSDVEELLRSVLPTGDERFELRLGTGESPVTEEDGWIKARLMIVLHEIGEERFIRDCKEQEVALLDAARREDAARASAYLRAWARALPAITRVVAGGDIDVCMPCDLLFPRAFDEAGVREEADFLALFESEWLAQQCRQDELDLFRSEMDHLGVGEHAEQLMALWRPSIRLIVDAERYLDEDDPRWLSEDVEEDDSPVGVSKIGGLPDLPPGVLWPQIEGKAISFLAQIRLSDLRGMPGAETLPDSGLLAFFHDADGRTNHDAEGKWCWPVRHRGGTRVIHFEGDTFVRAEPPDKDRPRAERPRVFHPYPVERCVSERMMPPMESPFYEALDDEPHDQDWYFRFSSVAAMSGDDRERPAHRLLGYTSELQGDPYLEAHVYSSGLDFDGWDRDGARERAHQRTATEWRLLLQVDSTPGDLLCQDGGYFYFLIRADDLAARRFDQVWGIGQGH